jgi:alcohol dehydrogenase (cytochrome c)/quinohemoprotein ethanol dehydrogenase
LPDIQKPELHPPPATAGAAEVARGADRYQRYCAMCHGDVAVSGGLLPDLRYSSTLADDHWFQIVLGGLLKERGMVSFERELSRHDAEAIRAYVIARANQSLAAEKSAATK